MERATSTEHNNESWGSINYGPDVHNEQISGTLDLGLYYSPTKKQMQVAKIPQADRATSAYVIGAPGSGKTKYLVSQILQDIIYGNGFAVIDPHGDLIEDVKGLLAYHCYKHDRIEEMAERVVIIDPTDTARTIVFNPLEAMGVSIPEQASELISSFRKIWSDSWGSRLETILRNSLIALGEAELTLCELPLFLTRRTFRAAVLQNVTNHTVIGYFRHFDTMTDRAQTTWIDPILNKIDAFLSDERIRQIFSSPKSSFNLRRIMDEKKILLINLNKGKIRGGAADLLGSLLLAKLQMAAFSRSDIPPSQRVPYYLYIDEFQNYASDSFQVVLSEARKYGLRLIMAHQSLTQIPDHLSDLILSCAGLQFYFRVNRSDASHLAKEVFQYSDYEVKSKDREAVPWNWERKISYLQHLPPRTFLAKHKIQGGTLELRTIDIPQPWDMMGVTQAFYSDYLSTIPFGKQYLRSREELQAQSIERLKSMENMSKPEAHTGKPASTSTPAPDPALRVEPIEHQVSEKPITPPSTFYAAPRPPKAEPIVEREHRRLQHLIKKLAEQSGYLATIEQPTDDGTGRVDVGLEKDGEKTACEISVTTTPEHEVGNIRKCLASDYGRVIVCSPEKKHLVKIKRLCTKELTKPELEKLLFLEPAELTMMFEEEAANAAANTGKVKGYKVNTTYQPLDEAERETKRQALANTILRSLRPPKE